MAGDRTKRERNTERESETKVKANANRDQSNTVKDPDEWTTGDERMTGAQQSYLKTLSEEAHEPFDPNLTKAEASKRIDELQEKTGRGQNSEESDGR